MIEIETNRVPSVPRMSLGYWLGRLAHREGVIAEILSHADQERRAGASFHAAEAERLRGIIARIRAGEKVETVC